MPDQTSTQADDARLPSGPGVGRSADVPAPGTSGSVAGMPRAMPVCPYLLVPGAAWRAARPLREHRCTAVSPLDAPSLETQRVLCLVAGHVGCPRFQAATAERRLRWRGRPEDLVAFDARVARRVPRATPIVLDRPSAMVGPLGLLGSSRRLARLALATVMIIAAGLLLAARFVGGSAESDAAPPSGSPDRPSATSRPSASMTATPGQGSPSASPGSVAP